MPAQVDEYTKSNGRSGGTAKEWSGTATTSANYPNDSGVPIFGYSKKYYTANGTWDGATVKWQFSDDGTTWWDVTDGSRTSDAAVGENDALARFARLNVSSVGGSTSLALFMRYE